MAAHPVPFKPLAEAIEDLESAAAQVVLAVSEQERGLGGDVMPAIGRLAAALWELQRIRQRVDDLVGELGTPPLYVVTTSCARAFAAHAQSPPCRVCTRLPPAAWQLLGPFPSLPSPFDRLATKPPPACPEGDVPSSVELR